MTDLQNGKRLVQSISLLLFTMDIGDTFTRKYKLLGNYFVFCSFNRIFATEMVRNSNIPTDHSPCVEVVI